MGIQTEVRLNVTDLFFPDIVTPPGTTPYNLKHIRDEFDKKFIERFPSEPTEYQFVELTTDQGVTSTHIWSVRFNEYQLTEVAIETAKVFYPTISNEIEFNFTELDLMVREVLLEPVFKS